MPLYRSGFSYTPETWARLIGSPPARREGCEQRMSVVASPTRVLLITGFDSMVPVTSTVDGAVEKLGARAPPAPA